MKIKQVTLDQQIELIKQEFSDTNFHFSTAIFKDHAELRVLVLTGGMLSKVKKFCIGIDVEDLWVFVRPGSILGTQLEGFTSGRRV